MGTSLAGFRFDGTRGAAALLEAWANALLLDPRCVRRVLALEPCSARGGHVTEGDVGRVLYAHQHGSAVRGSNPGARETSAGHPGFGGRNVRFPGSRLGRPRPGVAIESS